MAMRYDSGSKYTLRIGDAERDEAATQLSQHFVAGRLTTDEFNERLDKALTAKTADQLSHIMADLPKLHKPRPEPVRRHAGEPSLAARYAALALVAVLVLLWMSALTLIFHQAGGPHSYPLVSNH